MRIAVLSSFAFAKIYENYGSALQYFALQNYLKKMGHSVFWIRYIPKKERGISRSRLKKLLSPSATLNFLRQRLNASRQVSYPRGFDDFFYKYLNLSERTFDSIEELREFPPEADVYIVGSDQIWHSANEIVFLDFGPKDIKRISYAASSKWGHLSSDWYRIARKYISSFYAVSVREKQGIIECAKAGRNDAKWVVDPTLLLKKEDYLKLLAVKNPCEGNGFLLGYFLNIDSISSIPWQEIKGLSSRKGLGLKVIPLQGAEKCIPRENIIIPTLEEWVQLYSDADYVVTNSFHGTVFSIIMKKPFLVTLQKGHTARENARFTSILGSLGLEGRIYDSDGGESIIVRMDEEIIWSDVEDKLNELTESSKEFLRMAIS